MSSPAAKYADLLEIIVEMRSVVVAYSGGVDSSLLAHAGHEALSSDSLAVTAVSPSLARRELKHARELANRRGWNYRTLRTHELRREAYAKNDRNRCYWCKVELFDVLAPLASERRAQVVVGTNLDDLDDYRPGQAAGAERGVRAPFVEVGLSKAGVRSLSRSLGLPTADKAAAPCLSSRIAYGIHVTPERLRRVDKAEEYLLSLGFHELRVRDHGDLARIEVPKGDVERVARVGNEIVRALTELGFKYVTLDLGGLRSGSMNDVLLPTIRSAHHPDTTP